ncbi:zf-HC2 domain-containing protein [Dehalococcoidia bacterium]|nr:zf-HC2 domain-containing protein [Dehalococcoidia bacterium]
MNCKDIGQLLVAYLDGEVTPGERGAIDAHLSTCPGCREDLEALTITQKRFRQALEYVAAPLAPGAWLRLEQRIEAGKRPWFCIPRLRDLLRSPAPAWKAAVGGALVVALIAGLVILATMPAPALQLPPALEGWALGPSKALAQTVALNSPEVLAAFGEDAGELTVAHVTIRNGRGMVIMTAEGVSRFLAVNVHLKERGVIDIQEIPVEARLSWPELTEEEKEWVINIAKADSRVQELLARGFVVQYVGPTLSSGQATTVDWLGRVVRETLMVTIDKAFVKMQLADTEWHIITIDVEEEKVESIDEAPVTLWAEPIPRLSREQELKAIDIARAHPLVQEFLDKGAIISGAMYPRTVTYENGRRLVSRRYGPEKDEVSILYADEYGFRHWDILVNLAEEKVVSIEEKEGGFCFETKTWFTKERTIYP